MASQIRNGKLSSQVSGFVDRMMWSAASNIRVISKRAKWRASIEKLPVDSKPSRLLP